MTDQINGSWLAPGSKVVIFEPGRFSAFVNLKLATVDRVLKRDVVLSTGDRFRLDSLQQFDGSPALAKSNGTWDPSTFLLPRDAPKVAAAVEKNRILRAKSKVSSACASWERESDSAELLCQLAEAIDELKKLMS